LLLPFVALVAAVSVLLVVVSFEAARKREPPPVDLQAPLRNVHALGINPADGLIYAATFGGVFRIESGDRALRLAQSYQNSTGFIVVGPNEFLAGGSPDFRDVISGFAVRDAGLIRSTDAGRSWRTVSLGGEARLTALSLVGGKLYGYDDLSKSFRVSDARGRTWEELSKLEGMVDFAVSPGGGLRIFATIEDRAMVMSDDGGRSWQGTPPAFQLIEWPAPDQLWAVDAEGGIHLSRDAGATWEQPGDAPDAVRAFYAQPALLLVALRDNRIFASTDGGRTWSLRFQDPDWQPPLDFSSD
jgi:hypothetical protein